MLCRCRACGNWRGAALEFPEVTPSIEAAAVVAAIVAKGEPVYGINTGFGKLANMRIADSDLETLQRNLVLSHAAGVGEPMPAAIVRLMMALKLISLGRGASGMRRESVKLLHGMLAGDVIPMIPARRARSGPRAILRRWPISPPP